MASINIKRIGRIAVAIALMVSTYGLTSCNPGQARVAAKIIHGIDHANQHSGTQTDGTLQYSQANNNSPEGDVQSFCVEGICTSHNGGFTYDMPSSARAIRTSSSFDLEIAQVRYRIQNNTTSTITVPATLSDVPIDGGDVPSHKSLDVSSYNFMSSDNNYTYYFNVY